MEISKRKKDKICGICGSIGYAENIVTCYQCKKASEHMYVALRYCMQKHVNLNPVEWYCDECQLSAKPVHGTQVKDMNRAKTRTPPHSPDITKEGRVPTKHAKVKFIPTEEVTFLTRGKLVGRRDNLSPSCLVTTPPKLKRASASMSMVPASKTILLSPPRPGSVNAEACIAPKSASIGHTGKSKELEMQKNKSSGGILCPNIQSRGPDLDVSDLPVTLIINPKEKLPHPASEACWMGTFEFFEVVPHIHNGIQAHFAHQVSLKAYEALKQMPKELKLDILPRLDAWPKMFQSDPPDYNDIGVYFFSHGLARPKEKYIRLLERISARDIAMKTYVDTNIQLLIYSSNVLPAHCQFIDGQVYLWGLFKKAKRRNQPKPEQTPFCSPASTSIDKCDQLITPLQIKSEEIDVDIDMVGGNDVGRVDIPIQRIDKPKQRNDTPPGFAYDGPPGFSRPISNGGNKEKQPLVKFSLKNVKKPAFTEFLTGCARVPVLKQESNSNALLKGEKLSDNSPPSSAIGGYSGTAPKACERQREQQQAQGKMQRSVGHSRTTSPCPSIEKKRGFNSEEQLLAETKPHVPSMKLASLSAKESKKCFSESPLFKSCGRNGEAALTHMHTSPKKQDSDFKKANHTGPKPRNLGPQNRMMGLKKWDVTEERETRSMGSWRKWDEPSEKLSHVSIAYQSPFSSGKKATPPSPWPTWEDHANKVSKKKQDLPSGSGAW